MTDIKAIQLHFMRCVQQWEHYGVLTDMLPRDDPRVVEAETKLHELLGQFQLQRPLT